MNEFIEKYRKLNHAQRVKARENAMAGVMLNMSLSFKGNHTKAQMRAAARKIVDQGMAVARRLP